MGLRGAASMAARRGRRLGRARPLAGPHRHRHAGDLFGSSSPGWSGPALGLLLAGSFLPLILDWRLGRPLVARPRRAGPAARGRPSAAPDGRRRRAPRPSAVPAAGRGRRRALWWSVGWCSACTRWCTLVGAWCWRSCSRTSARARPARPTSRPVGAGRDRSPSSLFSGYGPLHRRSWRGSVSMGIDLADRRRRSGRSTPASGLGASPRAQMGAQLLGALLGGAGGRSRSTSSSSRPTASAPRAMPAPSAMSWKATAEAVRGGFARCRRTAPSPAPIGLGAGVAADARSAAAAWGRFLPSAGGHGHRDAHAAVR